jgi:hypothetical protein
MNVGGLYLLCGVLIAVFMIYGNGDNGSGFAF